MGGQNTIVHQPAPATASQPSVNFDKDAFDAIIWQKGYKVYHDKAVKCPCKVHHSDNLSVCRNCGGSGWVLYNRVETRMVIQSMNLDTQYKDWTEETLGTCRISAADRDRLSYMDRIIVLDGITQFSEILYPKNYKGKCFAYTTYDILEIEEAWLFVDPNEPLVLMEEGVDFEIIQNANQQNQCGALGYIFQLKKYTDWKNITVSLRYKHRPSYHIIDQPRDSMSTPVLDNRKIPQDTQMPVSAVARRVHYVLDRENYSGDYLFDNSYETPS